MTTLNVFGLEIPWDVHTLEGFRRWVETLDEHAPLVHFSRGAVHIEMPQDYETHGPIVEAAAEVLRPLARELDLGKYHTAPSWITEEATGLSTEPDGFLVRWDSLASGRVRINPSRKTELLGHPDMVLEVVSRSSRKKDLHGLVGDYAAAGVAEYWIAEWQHSGVSLRILLLAPDGNYRDQEPDRDLWLASPVWRRSFRFVPFVDRVGLRDVHLEVRSPDMD